MSAPGDSQGQARASQGLALATGERGGESAGQARDSQRQALATGQPGGETARQPGGLSRSHGLAHATPGLALATPSSRRRRLARPWRVGFWRLASSPAFGFSTRL